MNIVESKNYTMNAGRVLFHGCTERFRSHLRPKFAVMKKSILVASAFLSFSAVSSFSAQVGVIAHINVPEDMPSNLQVRVGGTCNFGGILGSYATSSGGAETLVSSHVFWTPGDETVMYTLGLSGNSLYGRTVAIGPYLSVKNLYSGTSSDYAYVLSPAQSQHFPNVDGANGNREIHVYYYIDPIGVTNAYPVELSAESEDSDTDEPIDTKNGNNYFTEKRIFVPCPGIPLKVDLKYQSVSDLPIGTLGEGWRHSLEWDLDVQTHQVALYTGNGRKKVFGEDGNGGYLPPDDKHWELKEIAVGYEVEMPGGWVYAFNTNGMLSAIHDAWGNDVECSYGTNGCLESATHSNGRQIAFSNTWHTADNEWRIASISVQNGISMAFDYNGDGQFTQVVEQVGENSCTSSYQYTDSILTHKINGAGFEYAYEYERGPNGLLNGKGTYLDVDGYYEHEVGYIYSDTTDVRYSMRGKEQVYRYSRNGDGMLATKYGPGVSISEAMTRGVNYSYAANNEDRTETTLFDQGIEDIWSQWMLYDDAHNLTNYAVSYCTTNPIHQISMEYESQWQMPSAFVDAEDRRVEILYTNGSPLAVKDFYTSSNSYDTCYSYTTNGLLKAVTNANGHVVNYGYDDDGNLSTITPELGPVVTNTYDALGFLKTTEFFVVESEFVSRRITDYGRDAKGRVEWIRYPDGLTNFYAYNALSYLTNSVDRAGRETDYTYAPTEQLISITRYLEQGGSNVPVRISYDLDEQMNHLSITEPRARHVESYQLDIQDRVTSVTNIESQVMSIDYSVGNFVEQITRFDGSILTNGYDGTGRLTSAIYHAQSASPFTISYDYYADSQIKRIDDSASTNSYTYDKLNRLTTATNLIGSLPSVTGYQYDSVGNITNTTVSVGGIEAGSASYRFDTAERLYSISSPSSGTAMNAAFIYSYNPRNGGVATVRNTNSGITCTYGYDIMERIDSITYTKADSSLIRSVNYDYDAVGMITNKTITGGVDSLSMIYEYDSINRLTGETRRMYGYPARTAEYVYDLAGNRQTNTDNDCSVSYTLGAGNRLASWSASYLNERVTDVRGASSETIGTDDRWGELWVSNLTAQVGARPQTEGASFLASNVAIQMGTNEFVAAIRDEAGNMGYATNTLVYAVVTNGTLLYNAAGCVTNISHTGTGGCSDNLALEWDERYRLTGVSLAEAQGTQRIEYGYDALNRRVSRMEGGTTNYFVYDANRIVADVDSSGTLLKSYVWGMGIDNLMSFTDHATTNTYYTIKDHQNTVLAVTDSEGNVVETYDYDAYGRTKVFSAAGTERTASAYGNRYTYQGREIEWSTGLYYFRARWYQPEAGRWLSKDPIGIEGGLNQYVFCDNNPVNFMDPSGLDVAYLIDSAAVAGAGHGAAAVGNGNTGWTYYSFGPGQNVFDTSDNLDIQRYKTYEDLLDANARYDGNIRYTTDQAQDRAAHAEALSKIGDRYNLFGRNCDDIAVDILRAAQIKLGDYWRPIDTFNNLPQPDRKVE